MKKTISIMILGILLIGMFPVFIVSAESEVGFSSTNPSEDLDPKSCPAIPCSIEKCPYGCLVDDKDCPTGECLDPTPCPQYSPHAPGWCESGVIIYQTTKENECPQPPTCTSPTQGGTTTTPVRTTQTRPGTVSCQKGCVCNEEVMICTKEGEIFDLIITTPGWSEDEVSDYKYDKGEDPSQGPTGQADLGSTSVSISMTKQGDIIKIKSGEVEAVTSEEVSVIKSKLIMKTSNGINSEIKIMPKTASETAIAKLGKLNFTIELKETGKGDNIKPIYELKAKKQGKILGIFKVEGEVSTQIDAETGDIISTKKPWWAFLASEI